MCLCVRSRVCCVSGLPYTSIVARRFWPPELCCWFSYRLQAGYHAIHAVMKNLSYRDRRRRFFIIGRKARACGAAGSTWQGPRSSPSSHSNVNIMLRERALGAVLARTCACAVRALYAWAPRLRGFRPMHTVKRKCAYAILRVLLVDRGNREAARARV